MDETLLDVEHLSVGFLSKHGVTAAISDVSFRVKKGEIVCLVGESGSGKTVTSLSVMRLIEHDNGLVLDGQISFEQADVVAMSQTQVQKLRGKQISMIFQEPMTAMDPVFTIGQQIIEVLCRHEAMSKSMARQRATTLLTRVGIPDAQMRLRQYPHELSGGMRQRAMIAMALACNPKLLIADEPTTALDVTIQAQILDLLRELQTEFNMSILLITHDLGVAAEMSNRIIVMYAGKVVEQATAKELFDQPFHPYTQGLMRSVPTMEGERRSVLHTIPGTIPNLSQLPTGCRFHPRCPYASEKCVQEQPPLQVIGGREVACWHVDQVTASSLSEGTPGSTTERVTNESAKNISRANQSGQHAQLTTSVGAVVAVAVNVESARMSAGNVQLRQLDMTGTHVPLVEVSHVRKYFPVKRGILNHTVAHVRAVDDVSFAIEQGETFGVVGESGCGKSTLGRVILNLQRPTSGRVMFEGKELQNLKAEELRDMRQAMQIIFQDPYGSLNPRWKVGDIIAEPLRVHGMMQSRERASRVQELLEWVGLDAAADQRFPHEFSGGQRQRIGIARAIALNPKFVVCDEPVSALDVSVQSQVINLLIGLQQRLGLTYLFIAHGLNVVRHISDRIGVMYLGKMVEVATADELFSHPSHPYTRALLSVIPIADPNRRTDRVILQGEIPSPSNPPSGCRFRTRCPFATERCANEEPELKLLGTGHWVACHYAN